MKRQDVAHGGSQLDMTAPADAEGTARGAPDWPRVLAKGAVAGVAATSALVATGETLYRLESEVVKERDATAREGHFASPLQKPIAKLADVAGRRLDKRQEERAARALAWAVGIGGGIAYAIARERMPSVAVGGGLAFGAGAWLLEDELLVPLATGTFHPRRYPWQAHARGLAAHLAYGAAAEASLRAMDRAA